MCSDSELLESRIYAEIRETKKGRDDDLGVVSTVVQVGRDDVLEETDTITPVDFFGRINEVSPRV